MGFFSLPVRHVSNTRIYVSPSESQRDTQLTLYSNSIDSHLPGNCFVIPVPYPETVRFHYHPEAYQFLDRLEESFVPSMPHFHSRYPHSDRDLTDYRVRHVVSLDEFEFINHEEDILHPDVLDVLKQKYSEPFWGVIVVDIRSGVFEYNPLVYSHRKLHNSLFVPTLHHYPRDVNDSDVLHISRTWDHRLYVNGTHRTPGDGETSPPRLSSVPWRLLPPSFRQPLQHLISRHYRREHVNQDFMFPIYRISEPLYPSPPRTPPRISRMSREDRLSPPSSSSPSSLMD